MADVKAIADQLVGLTVKEVNELLDVLKEEHGIEPAAAAVAVAGPAAGGGDVAAEEKNSFDVILKAPGGAKLQIVKLVKELTGLSSATIYSRVSKKTIPVQCRQRPLVFSEKHIIMWLQANRPKTDFIEEIEDILKQKAVKVNNTS